MPMRYRKLKVSGWKNRTCQAGARLALAALAVASVAGCRVDMHIQPKYKADEGTSFFPDGRANRPLLPDTVAYGNMHNDELLYTGRVNGVIVDQFPFTVPPKILERGRARFNIYCSPCHDYTGSGRGMIVQRG